MNTKFELPSRTRCRGAILQWATRYMSTNDNERKDKDVEEIVPAIRSEKCCTAGELKKICSWKTNGRSVRYCTDDDGFVKEVTRTSFSASHDRFRIEVLTVLPGVGWPTASAILHFYFDPFDRSKADEGYPVLDWRALDAVGAINRRDEIKYDYHFWDQYTKYCRGEAKRLGVSMRDLDRALWQFSRENS